MARRGDVERVELRELQGTVEDIRYVKRDDGEHYIHDVESENDLWLVDVDGRRGTLMVPRDRTPMWSKDGGTHWLTNPRTRKGGTMAARTKKRASAPRRRSTTRRKTKRLPPRGFKTWSAYMASIRPSTHTKGEPVAARKKRRARARKNPRRRRHVARARINPPTRRSRRRGHRRNPGLSIAGISTGSIISQVKTGAIHGVAMVAGEASSRLVRSRVFGKTAGTMLSGGIELGVGVLGGLIVQKMLGRDIGQAFTDGVCACVTRVALKQSGSPLANEALSDGGGRRRFMITKAGKVVPVSGYVGNNRLSGYVGNGRGLNGIGVRQDEEIYGPGAS